MNVYRAGGELLIALVITALLAGTGIAQTTATPPSAAKRAEGARWIPGLSLNTGFLVGQRDGLTESEERGSQVGDTTTFSGFLGARAEIQTPRIARIPTAPRIFARADVSYSLDNDEAITNEGDPGDPITNLDNRLGAGEPVLGVLGVGTTLRSQTEPLILSGALGMIFSKDIAGRTVRFRPSLEWMFLREELRLAFGDAESEGSDPIRCNPCRVTSSEIQTTKAYHSMGPGMELDVDAGRWGGFKVSLFTQFKVLRILGDRKVNLASTSSWFTREETVVNGQAVITSIDPAVGRADTTVRAKYRRDPWNYVGLAGIRIVWSPE